MAEFTGELAAHPPIELAQVVAGVVITTPGVVRLEPSLSNALRRMLPSQLPKAPAAAEVDGVDGVVVRTRDDLVEVTVDIAVSAPPTAVQVAVATERRIRAALTDLGSTAVGITVNVLSIESPDLPH